MAGHGQGKRGARGHPHQDNPVTEAARDGECFPAVRQPVLGGDGGERVALQAVARESSLEKVGAQGLGDPFGHRGNFLPRGGKPMQVDQYSVRAFTGSRCPADALLGAGHDAVSPRNRRFTRLEVGPRIVRQGHALNRRTEGRRPGQPAADQQQRADERRYEDQPPDGGVWALAVCWPTAPAPRFGPRILMPLSSVSAS